MQVLYCMLCVSSLVIIVWYVHVVMHVCVGVHCNHLIPPHFNVYMCMCSFLIDISNSVRYLEKVRVISSLVSSMADDLTLYWNLFHDQFPGECASLVVVSPTYAYTEREEER